MSNSELIRSFIHAEFNTTHFHDEFTEKAYFCGDCGGNSLTHNEKETEHVGHHVIRAMKNSQHYCYKKDDILRLKPNIDVSGVCTYTINSFFVYFPKSRVKFRGECGGSLGKQGCCRACGWNLPSQQTGVFYCSILCKLEFTAGDFERVDDLVTEQQDLGSSSIINRSSKKRKRGFGGSKKFGGKSNKRAVCLKIKHGGKTVTLGKKLDELVEDGLNNFSYRKRSRKGTPRRAPLY